MLHSGFPHRSATASNQLSDVSASLQYTTGHFVKSPYIPSLLVRYQSGDNRGDNRVDNCTLKAFQQVLLCISFGSTAKVSLHYIAPLNVYCSAFALSNCVINRRSLLSTSSNPRAPSFFLAFRRSLITVSIGALLISFHINVSCLTSVHSRFTCSNPLRPVINKVYQQGVSTAWTLTKSLRHTDLFPSFPIVPFSF